MTACQDVGFEACQDPRRGYVPPGARCGAGLIELLFSGERLRAPATQCELAICARWVTQHRGYHVRAINKGGPMPGSHV